MEWITKDGTVLTLNDMSEQHIINAIRWLVNDPSFGTLIKDGHRDSYWVEVFAAELNKRSAIEEICKVYYNTYKGINNE